MQRIEARIGQVIMVGMQPVGIEHAASGRVWLVTPNCVQETTEDVQRHVQRRRKAIDKAVEKRKTR